MVQIKSGGNLIEKISSYLQIVSKDPHSTAFFPLAEAFRQIGLLDDALAAARLGTEALPKFSPGFATLGQILLQMGRLEEATAAYKQALDIDQQNQLALLGMARLHLIRGDRVGAREVLQCAAEYHPQDEMIDNMLLGLDLRCPWANVVAATELAAGDMLPGTAAGLGEEVEGAPIPTATLAEIYVKQGLVDQAIRVYEEILRLDPGNAAILGRLAELRPPEPVEVAPSAAREIEVKPVRSLPREPLAVFEGWLQAIALRRAHVQ